MMPLAYPKGILASTLLDFKVQAALIPYFSKQFSWINFK